jgi:hypothetical protein
MEIQTQLEEALNAPQPRARLQALMAELLERGLERDEIFSALETCQLRLAETGRDADRELILEALDGFTGWCRLP